MRILITGVGNVLRQDDGFGIAVINRLLEEAKLPPEIRVMETGIAGIRLVQELLDGYDALLIVDAVQRGGEPGQLYWLAAEVPDVTQFPFDQRNEFLADMHYTNPTRAMMLAKAINVLPAQVYILGCQPAHYDDFALGLSPVVETAVARAVQEILAWIERIQNYKEIAR